MTSALLRPVRLLTISVLTLTGSASAAENGNGNIFTQKPTIEATSVAGTESPLPESAAAEAANKALSAGPPAQWIWGADENARYVLKKKFDANAETAWVRATCDNRMTLMVNGQRVASSDSWEQPVQVEISEHLRPGANELAVAVSNEGGIAGLALKLALTDADGNVTHVVTDDSWRATQRQRGGEAVAARVVGTMGDAPWGDVLSEAGSVAAANRGVFNVLPGYQVELLYTVPKDEQGSWVSIAFDDSGRLIASDQGDKGLFRITPPPVGSDEPTKIEPLSAEITAAQGMLHAFGNLYVSVNGGPGSGLYLVKDTDGDDQYDQVTKLKEIRGGGEHGPHALRLSPDGQSIYWIAGNHTLPPDDFDHSRVPKNWGEDLLLPRQWDANGHARGILAPGGWIAKTDPEGQKWEIISAGYRNPYDMDFNADGELFAYDADMEWDFGTPWYRPTRVTHSVSGSEFGWRSGTGKWPAYYVDSLPPLLDIGPGSPVGATFGYGARFPEKYQKAFYICDWTFGTMYAVHIEPDGASYRATKEEFVSRTPLPLTDAAVGPDGALYFTIGGRGTQSELYRVTYVGDEATEPVDAKDARFAELRQLRQQIEQYHRPAADAAAAVDFVWSHLSHADRYIRYAARVALEHQPLSVWHDRALAEQDPQKLITAAVALSRQGDSSLQGKLLSALERIDIASLEETPQLELLRAYQLVFIRMGEPDAESPQVARLVERLDSLYPASTDPLNRELVQLLVYLDSPTVVTKTIALMKQPSQQKTDDLSELLARNVGYGKTVAEVLANQVDLQKLHYAFVLRNAQEGWSLDQRRFYWEWLQEARGRSGGASYQGFLNNIEQEAFDNATDSERLAIEAFGLREPYAAPELPAPHGPAANLTLAQVVELAQTELKGRDFENGKRAYAAARCVVCHRFGGEGGATGPDLTQVAGRFNAKDLAESILDPSKVISDQYRASVVITSDGSLYTGRIVADTEAQITVLLDPEDSTKIVDIPREDVEELQPSAVSIMPEDLLNPLNQDEVLDMLAYLLSRGNPEDPMFQP